MVCELYLKKLLQKQNQTKNSLLFYSLHLEYPSGLRGVRKAWRDPATEGGQKRRKNKGVESA